MPDPGPMVIGLYDSPGELLRGIQALREQGLEPLDACTPYPVHGLAQALRLRRSPLGGMVMAMGTLGALLALGFQYWTSAVDYPLMTGGKAPESWEAFLPVIFEVTVLFGTFTAGLGMLVLLNGLPFFGHPILASRSMAAITRDRFALVLAGPGAASDLLAAGAREVEELPGQEPEPRFTSRFALRALGGILAASLLAGLATRFAVKLMPVLAPMSHLQTQPRMDAQAPSAFFPDGAGMRMPAPFTVARGHLPSEAGSQEAAASLVNPLPRTPGILARGRQAYAQRCALCHGPLGDGKGSLTAAYGAKPANLHSRSILEGPDGRIHWVILHGKNAMPGHQADLDEAQAWAVVHHVRALQRAQHARNEDLDEVLNEDRNKDQEARP